jgi:hypothetical protein
MYPYLLKTKWQSFAKNLKIIKVILEVFNCQKLEKKFSKNRQISISCFAVCSQKCIRRSKDLYFIFGSLKILTRMEFPEASTSLLLEAKLPECSTILQPDMKVS